MDLNLLDLFKHVKNPQDFTAGETIIAAGMTGGTMYVVLEGEVEIRADDMLPNVAGPGTIVGGPGADRFRRPQRQRDREMWLQTGAGRSTPVRVHGAANALFRTSRDEGAG
jgi:hypothetical protein